MDRGRLALTSIDKNFDGSQVPALRGVSITTEPGEFVVVVGPSGCGKSTLLNVAAGILKPDGGTVTLDNKPVNGPGPQRTMVFQDHGLFPWLTAADNVAFPLALRRIKPMERRRRALEMLRLVRLEDFAGRYPHELSGGMRQRVSICRALIHQPDHF